MPRTQAAHVPTYQFGAPDVAGTPADVVLMFQVQQGGRQEFRFESAEADEDISVSVEVSETLPTWVPITVADNLVVITNEIIKPRTSRNFTVLLRAGKDNFVRIRATGGDRGELQIRGPAELEIRSPAVGQSTV